MSTSKMHADEVYTDVALVRRLLAAQFPQWADLLITPVPSAGTDNALYRLGDDMVVRLPRIHWAVNEVARGWQWLPRLAPHLSVAIPAPLAMGASGEGYPYPWSVYRWLEGENPIVGHLANPGLLARELGEFVAALRRIDPTGGPISGRSGPLAARDAAVRAAIAQLGDRIDARAVTAAWEAALQVPAWSGPLVWIHGDLSPGNLLLVNGRLSAVIDFLGAGVSDPAVDLPVAWNLLPADVRQIYRTVLQTDDDTWARGRGWALSIALLALPYYWDTNPSLAARARHVIREVLAEHQRGP